MAACLLCGESGITDMAAHAEALKHRRAAAEMSGSIAAVGRCPYCRDTRLDKCRNKEHKSALAECRRLLADLREGKAGT